MELIFDVRALQTAMVEMNYDAKKLPLGKLTPEQLKCVHAVALQEGEGNDSKGARVARER